MVKEKNRIKKQKNGNRLILYNDLTFQTLWSMKITGVKALTIIVSAGLLLVCITILAIAYTPARELIPGYPSAKTRIQIIHTAILVDSLEQQIRLRDDYFERLRTIIQGEVPDETAYDEDMPTSQVEAHFESFNHDSVFYESLLQEKLDISLLSGGMRHSNIADVHFFVPLQGMVSQKFDKNTDHFAVDIVALPNSRIAAVQKGTVIFTGWTTETGYVIYIQHDNNLISGYKHSSQLLKKPGDPVFAGEVIAFMGNTGELTTGPHLHFELWHKGVPVDPELYIDL